MTHQPAILPVSKPPGFHWFSYYDKFQFDPTDRYLLGMRADFDDRPPTEDDVVAIGMFDLADGNKWIELGESRAWCWQQGCMLQWRPSSDCEVVWNDRDGNRYVSRVLDVRTRAVRTLPRAIGNISPDGKLAVCEDFSRIWNFRQSYGYAGIPDPYKDQTAPAEIGVWRMDMNTGETRQLVSLAELVKIPYPDQTPEDSHYVNHLSWDPSGERFLMFNRWFGGKPETRVFTMDKEGDGLRLLSAHGAAHWAWRDPEHVLIWGEGAYRLYKDDDTGEPNETLFEYANGHQSYIPGRRREWLLTDTYPHNEERQQELYLYHIPSRTRVDLGCFNSPPRYTKGLRCDLHPRLSRSGTKVVIDSPHDGNGRQIYLIDIEDILERPI